MSRILTILKKHFTSDPFYFWSFTALAAINPIVSLFYQPDWLDLAITFALIYISGCLLTTLFCTMGHIGTILKYLSLTIVSLYDLLTLFCLAVFKSFMNATIIETLLETTPNEIKEFISVFIPWWLVVGFICLLASLFYAHYICHTKKRIKMGNKQSYLHLHLFVYIVTVLLIAHQIVIKEILSMSSWTIPFEDIAINLKDHEPRNIQLCESSQQHPQKIVLIIGESHSKGHSSIYGYEKDTNPRIQHLIDDSLVYAFHNIVSPATVTTQSFKYILNTRHHSDIQKEWYKFPSIITILKAAGYRTLWYSNQDEVGLYDNMASCFAHICDYYHFNTKKTRLDGDLISLHKPSKGKEFIIYHLMGQHVDFAKRYPESYKKFKATDYDKKKCQKREIAAHYDNACLYNDFVVSQLMEKYKNEDAIVIYYPDHGIDVFQSSPNYFGHAHGFKKESRKTGLQIPCFIYLSPLFKDHHKALTAQTQRSLDRKYCTADMTFTLMHVAGYDFAKHPTDTLYSLIK